MTITSLDLVAGADTLRFESTNYVVDPPYILKKITGIDADEIIPKFYGFNLDGDEKFYDLGLKPRSISILLQLNPRFALGETHKDLRDQLYKKILASRVGRVQLIFNEGTTAVAQIFGFITKFEAPQFSKTPTVQITVLCSDPMLRGISPVEIGATALNVDNTLEITDGISNAPHGFEIEITFTATLDYFTIKDSSTDPQWEFKVAPVVNFLSGNTLYISSEFGNKNIYMVASGVTTYLMDKVDPESVWPIIFPGMNTFYFEFYTSIDFNYLNYHAAFWGL